MLNEYLTKLISEAYPNASCIPLQGTLKRASILVLCLHCLMIRQGFRTASNKPLKRSLLSRLNPFAPPVSAYTPPASWLCLLPSPEFIFRYTYPGKDGVFILHCSLQERTERLLVHASEDGNRANIQIMGLQLDRSVPDSQDLKKACSSKGTWHGVVRNQGWIVENFKQYITYNLLRNAPDAEGELGNANRGRESGLPWFKVGLVVGIVAIVLSKIASHAG